MFQETIEVNGKKLSVSMHRQTEELNDYEMHMVFLEIRDYVNKGMIVEDSDNPGRYELDKEAITDLHHFGILILELDEDLFDKWFWDSFTVMIVEEAA